MASLRSIIEDARAHLDEASPAFYEDNQLATWIYEAARDLARRGETLKSTKSYTVVANQVRYDFPIDMLRHHALEFRRGGTTRIVEWRPFLEVADVWWNSEDSGEPQVWTDWGTPGIEGSQFQAYPVSSETLADGFRLYYYRLPHRPVDDDDLVEVPSGWEDLVTLYCEVNALRRAGSGRWREAQELYELRLGEMMKVTRHASDQASHIMGEDFYQGWLGAWPGWGDWGAW